MPWLDGDDQLNRPYGSAEFAQATAGLAVEDVVHVQVDATPAYGLLEAQWAAEQDRVAAIVAYAPLEDGDIARSYLDALARIDRVRGVRRLIQSEPDPEFPLRLVDGLRLLPCYGLSFDICIRHDQLAKSIEMVRACPETQFALDHLGKPAIRERRLDPWRAQIAELAALPNVVCKISGAVTEADHQRWTSADLAPFVSHALRSFGPDRVLFGSDWPVVTHAATYELWVDALRKLSSELSPDDQPKLWRENARRVYRL